MKFVIGLLFVLSVSFVNAEEKDLEKFFLSYLSDFASSKDVNSYFSESPQLIFGNHVTVLDSSKEANSVIQDIRSKLDQASYQNSKMVKVDIRAAIDDYSLVTLLLHRYKKSGKLLDKVCSTYGVLKTEKGYKILSWQPSNFKENHGCINA